MNTFNYHKQGGAVLIIALVMLLVLTLLATTSMRSTVLDARITGNHLHTTNLQNLANAALREGEFRLYGPGYIRDKLEPNMAENCKIDSKLSKSGLNKPCLLDDTKVDLDEYFKKPITELAGVSVDSGVLKWMPYRGLDAEKEFVFGENKPQSYWNVYRLMDGAEENAAFNPEYGDAMSGKGTFFFLVTGQADNEVAVQSTVSTVYLGMD
jgi:type IV pilus assembly protein PilX